MADWKQIEKCILDWLLLADSATFKTKDFAFLLTDKIRDMYENNMFPSIEKLSEEDKNEFYTTNLTADIKAVYERKT